MSQKNDQTPSDPPRRFQDFLVLTSGGVAVLALLFLTGAIGLVEWITGATVMTAGALAFYVGSVPSSNRSRESELLAPPPVEAPAPREDDIEQFILALPLPAVLISSQSQITSINSHAMRLFRRHHVG
ncbi:MAG: hypothetical protein AAGK93_08775 [Pseudomonadota bacterium]